MEGLWAANLRPRRRLDLIHAVVHDHKVGCKVHLATSMPFTKADSENNVGKVRLPLRLLLQQLHHQPHGLRQLAEFAVQIRRPLKASSV